MSKSGKMYKDTPKMERNQEGKMAVKKPSKNQEKEAPVTTGTEGMEVHSKMQEMHDRHINEAKDMHKRHQKEMKSMAAEHGKESGPGEEVEETK